MNISCWQLVSFNFLQMYKSLIFKAIQGQASACINMYLNTEGAKRAAEPLLWYQISLEKFLAL